jgi:hypothetical protein
MIFPLVILTSVIGAAIFSAAGSVAFDGPYMIIFLVDASPLKLFRAL